MKIVLTSNTSWSVYNFRLSLAKELVNKGYEVHIVSPEDSYSSVIGEIFPYHNIRINPKGMNPLEEIRSLVSYHRIFKFLEPSVVLSFTIKPNLYCAAVCKLLGIKLILTVTGLGVPFTRASYVYKTIRYVYKKAIAVSDYVFFQNAEDISLFESDLRKGHYSIVPGSGIDINRFKPLSIKRNEGFRFLMISRIIEEKGVKEYINAAGEISSKFEDVEFYLAGSFDESEPFISELVKEADFEGIVNYIGSLEDVRGEIAKADCIVLPSYYREGIPRVLLEAAAMEKPIITTDNVGCREVVEDGVNGFLCKPRDSRDLADKMIKMMNLSEEERIEMGRSGREKVIKEFDERIVIEEYLKAIERLVGKQ